MADVSENQATSNNVETDNIRSALHYAVGEICLAEEEEEEEEDVTMTSEAIHALTELVYQYTTTSLANDLQCFSKHANRRRTITVDDVKLVARKDKRLHASLERFCEENFGNENSLHHHPTSTGGRRGRGGGNRTTTKAAPTTDRSKSIGKSNLATTTTTTTKSRYSADKKESDCFDNLGLEQQRDQLLKEAMSSASSFGSASSSSSSEHGMQELENTDEDEHSMKEKKTRRLKSLRKKQDVSSNKGSSSGVGGKLSRFAALSDEEDDDDIQATMGKKPSKLRKKVNVSLHHDSSASFSEEEEMDFNERGKSPTCAIDLADDD